MICLRDDLSDLVVDALNSLRMKSLITFVLLSAQTGLAYSDEPLGQIRAFLNGEEFSWHTIMMTKGDHNIATASFKQSSGFAELYMQGHLEPRFVTKGMLSLDVRFQGQFTPGDAPTNIEINYMPDGMVGHFFTSRGTEPEANIDIVEFSHWGDFGEVTATFSGNLCANWLDRKGEQANCKKVSGQIQTRVFFE